MKILIHILFVFILYKRRLNQKIRSRTLMLYQKIQMFVLKKQKNKINY